MSEQEASLWQIVRELDERLRRRISHIRVTTSYESGELQAEAHLSIHLYLPAGQGRSRAGHYDVEVDLDGLPKGVSVSGIERYPNIVRRLSMVLPIEEQIRALHVSGLVGGLDAVRMQRKGQAWTYRDGKKVAVPADPREGPLSWHMKTHASSDRERLEWMLSVQRQDRAARAAGQEGAP